MAKSAVLLLALAGVSTAIYPDNHWDFSTELTTDNFDDHVASEISAGRTLFAPAWNKVTQAFAGNPDVSFGDVNLKEQKIRGDYNPGKGGWPTVRYFNKETGPKGAPYAKKTDKKMCDELGDDKYMTLYVEESGNTSRCSLDGQGCDERQIEYIAKMKEQGPEGQKKQLERLDAMDDKDMTPELSSWKNQRKNILQLFTKAAKKEEL